jgi:hypothetical protein
MKAAKGLLMKLTFSIAVLLVLAPALVQAKPRSVSAHMRPQLFHDRAPRVRMHEARLHEVHLPPPKSPPPLPPAKDDFQL